jgi:2-aminobenzoate-CoA ligase
VKPNPGDVVIGTPPIAFTFGLGGLVVFPMRAGAATVLVERATPEQLADHIAAHRATICFTAPTAYRAMLAAGKAPQLRSLRRCVSAGEHLPEHTWRAFHDATGIKIINGIGATEMLHVFISAADDYIRPGSTGRPVPARSDDMIVSSGYNIAGPEVEEALLAHPDVAECAVVAGPDDARGQIVCAFVVLHRRGDGDDATATELQNFVKQQIAPYKYPRRIEFLDALPRTRTGKLKRFELRERLGPGTAGDRLDVRGAGRSG